MKTLNNTYLLLGIFINKTSVRHHELLITYRIIKKIPMSVATMSW